MYRIKLIGLYGTNDTDAYYRAQGSYCFDFTFRADLATLMNTREECESILNQREWYLDQYAANDMIIEEVKLLDDAINE